MNTQTQQTYARTTSSGSVAGKANLMIRGLEIRIQYGIATGLFNEDERNEQVELASHNAFLLGAYEFDRDIATMPVMFADCPALAEQWQAGQQSAALMGCTTDCGYDDTDEI